MTVSEKRDLVAQNKEMEFLMLVGRFNPLLCCVKKTKGQNFVCAEGWHAQLTLFIRAFEVKKEKTLIGVPLPV